MNSSSPISGLVTAKANIDLVPYSKIMRSTVKPQTRAPSWKDLSLSQAPAAMHLDNIKAQLDLVLLGMEALIGIGSEEMLAAAAELNLESVVTDRVNLWRLRQSNPMRKSSGGRKKLDVEEARSLVLIICHLAKQHQELIRRAVTLLEQMTEQNTEPHRAALLGDYLDTFTQLYRERMDQGEKVSSVYLTQLALKLLVDLLFYGGPKGHQRLWLALLERAS